MFEKFNKVLHSYTGTDDTTTNIVDGDYDDCYYNLIISIVDGDYEIMMVANKEPSKEADSSLSNFSGNLSLIIKTQKIADSVFLIFESLMSDPQSETLLLKSIYSSRIYNLSGNSCIYAGAYLERSRKSMINFLQTYNPVHIVY